MTTSLSHQQPLLCTHPAELQDITNRWRAEGKKIALVPTMGALHKGHLSLVHQAHTLTDVEVVVSIFVNPLQFGLGEDFTKYPRNLDSDLQLLHAANVPIVYAPTVEAMYPHASASRTRVEPGEVGADLEGFIRPGHFAGMLTVVLKLLSAAQATWALFGEKDYQQLALIRQMVEDFNLPVTVLGVPTSRESDGLALSSRNVFLSSAERQHAKGLYAALCAGRHAENQGPAAVLAAAHQELQNYSLLTLDYLELRTPDLRHSAHYGEARLLLAARCGSVRLLDNMSIQLGMSGH